MSLLFFYLCIQELAKEFKGKFHYVKVDLRSEESILEAFKWIRSTLKSVDVLINNAGVLKPSDVLGKIVNYTYYFFVNDLRLKF